MTMTGPVPLKRIEQSLHRMRLAGYQLEGVANQLLNGSSDQRRIGKRLQDVLTVYQEELQKIGYMVEQGDQEPLSQEQLQIGMQVQEAINEISQI
ncbi:hypothetical protein CBW65_16560 [Tumebacillus avium]|uniref:Spo0E family sporulation regulatory protein-aspartic acid phosphatase n=1 Tax=Tumebacillus avium TaxID=1903704 RepID=A0A1Y0ISG9_9BACL|nr:hypothetical protein [Tumebacillus avium]ARU62395.1 hypothetical protein CBW65_16560 [Tumebacillus avium]